MRAWARFFALVMSVFVLVALQPGEARAAEGADLAAGSADLGALAAGEDPAGIGALAAGEEAANLGAQASTVATKWHRLYGATALDTMSAIVGAGGFAKGGTVVLVTAGGYWDALTAAGVAGMAKAPILMTDGQSLSPQTSKLIKNLAPKRIVVCGGTAAVSSRVANQARAAAGTSPSVSRLSGADAAGTAVSIFEEAPSAAGGKWSSTAFVCTGEGYWDALAAAPVSYAKRMPIFLTSSKDSISPSVLSAMKSNGVKSVWIVGGTAAVSDSVKARLQKSGIKVNGRLAGATAVETSEAVAERGLKLGMKADRMGAATTSGYWDALAGAAFCGKRNSVLVLVKDARSHSISGFVRSHTTEIKDAYIFGGKVAVSASTARSLAGNGVQESPDHYFRIDLPKSMTSVVTINRPYRGGLAVYYGEQIANCPMLLAITAVSPETFGNTPAASRQRRYFLGWANDGSAAYRVYLEVYFTDGSGKNVLWKNKNANTAMIERYCGMSEEELLSCIRLRDVKATDTSDPNYDGAIYWKPCEPEIERDDLAEK